MAKSISIPITGNSAPLRKALKESQSDLAKFAKSGKVQLAAAGAALTLFAKVAVSAAAEDQKSKALLAVALRRTVGANSELIESIDKSILSMSLATGIADDNLRPALSQLVRATGDVTTAQKLLTLGLDVSAGSGRDLSSVTMALSRAAMGNFTALKKLGVPISENTIKSKDLKAATDELQLLFGGSAEANAGTFQGQMSRLSVAVGEVYEGIGTLLLPTLQKLADKALIVTTALSEGGLAGANKAVGKIVKDNTHNLDGSVNGLGRFGNATIHATNMTKRFLNGLGAIARTVFRADTENLKLDGTLKQLTATEDTLALKEDGLVRARSGLILTTSTLITTQEQLNHFMGPVSSRNLQDLNQNYADYLKSLAGVGAGTGDTTTKTKSLKTSLKEGLAKSLVDAKEKLKSAKSAMKEFSNGIRDALTSTVSLSDAMSTASSTDDAYKTALQERAQAYKDLDQAKVSRDATQYAEALAKVADAEKNVTDSKAGQKSYTQAFQDQIAAAKSFAGNLKTLIGDPYKLGQAGLSQLLNLGPIAGNAVAADLLAGVGGFTTGSLNADLAGISAIAGQTGQAAGTAFMGGSVNTAASAVANLAGTTIGGTESAPTIIIQTGVGDPDAISRSVVKAIAHNDKRAGKVKVIAKKPTKKK